MKTSRVASLSILSIFSILLASHCRVREPGKPEHLRVGAILPLTGSAAEWGEPARDGLLLAVDELNARGGVQGRPITVDLQDDACEPRSGVSAAQKIVAAGKPVAIIGAVCSSVSLAIAPLLERQRVIMISPASTSPQLTTAGDYIFRVIPTDALRGEAFAKYVYGQHHFRVGVIYINNEGGAGNAKSFSAAFSALGGSVVATEAYPQDARDMRAQITRLAGKTPDAIIAVTYPDDTAVLLRQIRELDVKAPLYFQTEALDDPAVITRAGSAAEGVTYILPAPPGGRTAQSFAASFQRRYHHAPPTFAAEAYDAATLLGKCQAVEPAALRDCLYHTQHFAGASGDISFDRNGDVLKPFAIKQIRSGRPSIVTLTP